MKKITNQDKKRYEDFLKDLMLIQEKHSVVLFVGYDALELFDKRKIGKAITDIYVDIKNSNSLTYWQYDLFAFNHSGGGGTRKAIKMMQKGEEVSFSIERKGK